MGAGGSVCKLNLTFLLCISLVAWNRKQNEFTQLDWNTAMKLPRYFLKSVELLDWLLGPGYNLAFH